jgi:hypothetical protein
MKDMDWKIWLIVGVLALGGAFEMLKKFRSHRVKTASGWDLDFFGGSNNNSTPYNVKNRAQAQRPQAHSAPKAEAEPVKRPASPELEAFIAANTAQSTEFLHGEKGAEGKPEGDLKKKKAESEWEIYVDPVTGKMYRKKKKKKKDGAEAPIVPEEQVAEQKKEEEPERDDETVQDALREAIVTRNMTPPTGAKPKPYATLEEWVAKLLGHPDLNETKKFIEAYRTSLVSADIFYKIVNMMIEDSRQQMKELGVMAAGLTPSVMSFQILAEVSRTTPTSDSLRQAADGFIANYSDLGNLYILERILRAPSVSYTTVLAARRLEVSAQRYLSPELNQPPADPSQASTGVHSNASHFQRFVLILETLVRSPDQEVSTQANSTLTDLRARLNSAPGGGPNPSADTDPNATPTQASTLGF